MITPEIILGAPGAGKTTALLRLVAEELDAGTVPEAVGFITFTRRAQKEAVDRATEQFALPRSRFQYFSTIHALCFRALGMSSSQVLEGQKMEEFGDWIGVRVTGRYSLDEGSSFGFEAGDRMLFMENLARTRGISLRQQFDEEDDQQDWGAVERLARGLAEYKRAHHLYDYTDMLSIFLQQEWTPALEVLFVDEAQDLSWLQWQIVWKMAARCRRVIIAGDDDQSIFKWAGAAVDYFIDMQGRVTVLGQSWRVPRAVQAVSQRIIGQVTHRRPKKWSPRDEEGTVEELALRDLDWGGKDLLVLARNAKFLDNLRHQVRSSGYLYEYKGHPSVKESLRQAILTWERLRRGQPQTVESVLRVYEQMSVGVGVRRGHKSLPGWPKEAEVSLSDLRERGGLLREDVWHDALDRVPVGDREYVRACLRRREVLSQPPRIRLSTIHGAKGGEAEHVVLITDMAHRTWEESHDHPDDEARVFYVAATRAKDRLTLVRPRSEKHFLIR